MDRITNRGGEPDQIQRDVARALVERGGATWARVGGHEAGDRGRHTPVTVPGTGFHGGCDVAAEGIDDRALLERVAVLVSHYAAPSALGGS